MPTRIHTSVTHEHRPKIRLSSVADVVTPIEPPPVPVPQSYVHIVQAFTVDQAIASSGVNPVMNGIPFNQHHGYACNHDVNQAQLALVVRPGSIVVPYVVVNLVPRFGSPTSFYGKLRAPIAESAYFHSALPGTELNRIGEAGGANWYVRPSSDHGTAQANLILANIHAVYNGVFLDECQLRVPDTYWNAWRSAVDGPLASERAVYDNLWRENILSCAAVLKQARGASFCIWMNSAGEPYQLNCDGIWIEAGHFPLHAGPGDPLGELWALQQYATQFAYWNASPVKYGTVVANAAYDYPLQVAGLVARCYRLPLS